MINKKKFVKYIDTIQDLEEKTSKLYELGVDLDVLTDAICLSVNILKDAFTDKSDWIEYFCCELDFGKKYKSGMITFNDKNVSMKNAEELYDILIGNLLKKEVI